MDINGEIIYKWWISHCHIWVSELAVAEAIESQMAAEGLVTVGKLGSDSVQLHKRSQDVPKAELHSSHSNVFPQWNDQNLADNLVKYSGNTLPLYQCWHMLACHDGYNLIYITDIVRSICRGLLRHPSLHPTKLPRKGVIQPEMVPQVVNAKLVNIAPISRWFMADISVRQLWFI